MPPVAFHKGEYVPLEQASVGVMTHAFHYGTAVFEGIRGNWNNDAGKMYMFKLREHYERMLRGCKMLWIDIPYSADDLCDITREVVERSGFRQDLYIRPMAYKSEEKVANLNLRSLQDGFFCLAVPFGNYLDSDGAISCTVASWRRIDDTMVPPRFKLSGLYLNSILAKTDAIAMGFDEAIMLNMDGHVCEGTGENIFLVHGDTIATPESSFVDNRDQRDGSPQKLARQLLEKLMDCGNRFILVPMDARGDEQPWSLGRRVDFLEFHDSIPFPAACGFNLQTGKAAVAAGGIPIVACPRSSRPPC